MSSEKICVGRRQFSARLAWLILLLFIASFKLWQVEHDSEEVKEEEDVERQRDAKPFIEDYFLATVGKDMQCIISCKRRLASHSPKETFCGEKVAGRGINQWVVSSSFFGKNGSKYAQGISENLKLIQDFYPGWLFRLHVNIESLGEDVADMLCNLHCSSTIFDICPINTLIAPDFNISKAPGTIWRFLPLLDPQVEVALVRDIDSRPSAREASAVYQWLSVAREKGLFLHIMRDHPHHSDPMLAGMWGAARDDSEEFKSFQQKLRGLFEEAIHLKNYDKGTDQRLLDKWVFSNFWESSVVHDSYSCRMEHLQGGLHMAFRTRRKTGPRNFVGAAYAEELKRQCPLECRPPEHTDWLQC